MSEQAATEKRVPEVIDHTCSECRKQGKGAYRVQAACSNCDWTGEVRLSLGHQKPIGFASGVDCPRCQTQEELTRAALWDLMPASTKRIVTYALIAQNHEATDKGGQPE